MNRRVIRTNVSGFYPEELLSDRDSVLLLCEELNNRSGNGSVDRDVNLAEEHIGSSHEGTGRCRRRTLSVSIVATSSSASTVSPTCFDHDLRVPSEMDSAI